jgi:hypothetical protein
MNKRQLLRQLKNDVYCRLAPSKVVEGGVGVFAIREIPERTNPFLGCDDSRYVKIRKEKLEGNRIDPKFAKYLTDMCVFDGENFLVPSRGLQGIDLQYYLNHSPEPNMTAVGRGLVFLTNLLILPGQELTVDYNTYDDLEEDYRPRKPRNKVRGHPIILVV